MSDIAQLTADGKLALPDAVVSRFHPLDRFFVWTEGDTVHLKRLTPSRLNELATSSPQDEPLSLDEIAEEVHLHRSEQRNG